MSNIKKQLPKIKSLWKNSQNLLRKKKKKNTKITQTPEKIIVLHKVKISKYKKENKKREEKEKK